jgi:chromosome segregation ATPase
VTYAGATSDVSEAEARLKMLSETLEKLKDEANTLKKAKKSYREQLSNEEVALTKKIEVTDIC